MKLWQDTETAVRAQTDGPVTATHTLTGGAESSEGPANDRTRMMGTKTLIDATQKSLDRMENELKEACDVSAAAQLAWMDAEARVAEIEGEVVAVRAALRALKGEVPEVAPSVSDVQSDGVDSGPADEPEETADEFEARLKRERVIKERERRETGPYAGIQCNGCGEVGTLQDTMQSLGKSNRQIPVIQCRQCGTTKRR